MVDTALSGVRGRILERLTSVDYDHLLNHGFCVVDDALGDKMASELLAEMNKLDEMNLFLPNQVTHNCHYNPF
jgi:hypothetical protein